MDIEIRREPVRRIACMAHRGAYYKIGQVFPELMGWVQAHDVPFEAVLAVFYDDPATVPEEHLKSDAAVVVGPSYSTGDARIEMKDLKGGTYAVAVYKGPYSGLPKAWGDACDAAYKTYKHTHDGRHCFEVYVDDMSKVEPENLRTELYMPIDAP